MSGSGATTFSLILMINKEKTKVLFASVDNAFADVLLSFLMLPLGGIVKLLDTHYGGGDKAPTVGSLKTLYNGLQNLDGVYFNSEVGKQMLLNPRSSLEDDERRRMKLNVCGTTPTRYFTCECTSCMVSLYHKGTICTKCGKLMNKEIKVEGLISTAAVTKHEVFTKQVNSFIISDDLQIVPDVAGSIIQNLKNLGIMDMRGAEPKIVSVGLNEIMDLLKASLLSSSPLTDVFLHNGQIQHSAISKSEPLSSFPEEGNSSSKKMKIKAMFQKSTNKFLFAQAGHDFVDFLFSLLTIPFGKVESLLNKNSSVGSIDCLYTSVSNFDCAMCLKTDGTKGKLLEPKLPPKYLSNKQFFSLGEQPSANIFFYHKYFYRTCHWSTYYMESYSPVLPSFVDPKGQGCYMKESGMFMVMDDLTVKPLLMVTSLSTLGGMDIPLTDIEELEIDVGIEEAKSILKASLTSTSVFTNALKVNAVSQGHVGDFRGRVTNSYSIPKFIK